MKIFLRYQSSGTIYLLWLGVFYVNGGGQWTISDIVKTTNKDFFLAVLGAFPIGVILHQVSVNIKNCIVSKYLSGFDDFPNRVIPLCALEPNEKSCKSVEYYLDKISNLNSFYYARVDNGALAPLFAFITGLLVSPCWKKYFCFNAKPILVATILAAVLVAYLPRLNEEILYYSDRLKKLTECKKEKCDD